MKKDQTGKVRSVLLPLLFALRARDSLTYSMANFIEAVS